MAEHNLFNEETEKYLIRCMASSSTTRTNIIDKLRANDFYNPYCQKDEYIRILEQFSKELDHILETEQYAMKKHFKY